WRAKRRSVGTAPGGPPYWAAKQWSSPSPPVLRRSAWLQPPSGPREGCAEFHVREGSFAGASAFRPRRSVWPSIAAPWVLLVQFLQVRSSAPGNAVPSACEPVSTSCRVGVSPTPLTPSPFPVSAVGLLRLVAP